MKRYLFLFFVILINNSFSSEIIDNIKEEKKEFKDWNVSCQEDIMLNKIKCRLYSNFYKNTSSIYIQPNNIIANQAVILIPNALLNSTVSIKIDKNNIIESDIIDNSSQYGIIPFSPKIQKKIFNQIQNGDILYIRFFIKDLKSKNGKKEITNKISLMEFQKALLYYETQMNKFNN